MNSTFFLATLALLLLCVGCGQPDPADFVGAPPTDSGVKAGSSSGRVFYKVTAVEATYGGSAKKVMTDTWTDYTSDGICRFTSAGTNPNQNPFIGDPVHDTYSHALSVAGETRCGSTAGMSTNTKACTAPPLELKSASFGWTVTVAGFSDDSVVTLRAHPPSGLPFSCNFATLLTDADQSWGLEAMTTVGAFRAGNPFPVRFAGERILTFDSNTSKVKWDITVTISPLK